MDAAVQPRLGGIQRTYSHPLLDSPSTVHPGKLNPSGHDGPARRAGLHFRVQGGAHRGHGRGTAADPRPRRYADKYRNRGEPSHLIGVEFGRAVRNVVGFEVETVGVGRGGP